MGKAGERAKGNVPKPGAQHGPREMQAARGQSHRGHEHHGLNRCGPARQHVPPEAQGPCPARLAARRHSRRRAPPTAGAAPPLRQSPASGSGERRGARNRSRHHADPGGADQGAVGESVAAIDSPAPQTKARGGKVRAGGLGGCDGSGPGGRDGGGGVAAARDGTPHGATRARAPRAPEGSAAGGVRMDGTGARRRQRGCAPHAGHRDTGASADSRGASAVAPPHRGGRTDHGSARTPRSSDGAARRRRGRGPRDGSAPRHRTHPHRGPGREAPLAVRGPRRGGDHAPGATELRKPWPLRLRGAPRPAGHLRDRLRVGSGAHPASAGTDERPPRSPRALESTAREGDRRDRRVARGADLASARRG